MSNVNIDNVTKLVIEEGNGMVHEFDAAAAKRILLKHDLSQYITTKKFSWEQKDEPTVHINSKVIISKK